MTISLQQISDEMGHDWIKKTRREALRCHDDHQSFVPLPEYERNFIREKYRQYKAARRLEKRFEELGH